MNFSIAEWHVEGYISIRGVLGTLEASDSEIYYEDVVGSRLINQLSCHHYAPGG